LIKRLFNIILLKKLVYKLINITIPNINIILFIYNIRIV